MSADPSNVLSSYGWDDAWAAAFAPHAAIGYEPARVVVELRRHYYAVQTADGEVLGELTGKFHHAADRDAQSYPAVGDWVAVQIASDRQRAQIHALLPRRSCFSRQAAGERQVEQIVATNIDTVFLVSGLDANYNAKRIQRFFVAARDSGAQPVIILNKSDLCEDAETIRAEIELLVPGIPVAITSTYTRKGLKSLTETYALPGRTLAFVGSSGAGKSTLINRLLKDSDAMPTAEVREKDSRGRHTTTRRELTQTPTGALVIDTPGMREFQLWDAKEAVEDAYPDIVNLAAQCRFSRCTHLTEPGCAIRAALDAGTIPAERLDSYFKLKAEQAAKAPKQLKPGAHASAPGWRKKAAEAKTRPFRHRQHNEDE
ncbi:ribosome small subunit-dependent GTPase A [Rariglobus hedericola]|uniref:Small ribosomal subunit biogenesis GTPase RsgA n=1 Tax=Rariglobus hedericola TaxID=2597822 RepID=A0A556QS30_9BACT|nr:ribosome small subunit-dependent GTPase A [Rariglobus hedericola]TSJ79441.1 ribosome small subunit-dependent GTPase A [Rariglobus hedericola]